MVTKCKIICRRITILSEFLWKKKVTGNSYRKYIIKGYIHLFKGPLRSKEFGASNFRQQGSS